MLDDLISAAVWTIGAGTLVGLVLQVRASRPLYVCLRCGTADHPGTRTKGSIFIELVLWLCLIVPGLIYTIWRLTDGKVRVCRACGSEDIVPADSPAGRKITGGFVLLLVVSMSGCDILGPAADMVDQRPMPEVPAEYAEWYAEAEDCLDTRGDFDAVRWFVAADIRNREGTLVMGYWKRPHDITILRNAMTYERAVKHEAVHHILQLGDAAHGRPMEVCAVIAVE